MIALPPLSLSCIAGAVFVGSFLGTLVLRLPDERPILAGRSACDACGHALGARDLVPIASWAWNKRRCAYCSAELSTFYPMIELAALGVAVWASFVVQGWLLVVSCIFGWLLLALGAIDWRVRRLPDALTLPLLLAGLVQAYVFDQGQWLDHLIGTAVGFAIFWTIAAVYRRIRGRDGLGLGDAKLLAAIGAWLGWQAIPSVILIGAAGGLLYAVARVAVVRGASSRIAFGPFLAASAWIVWLYGPLVPR